jgi:hypothetical protein
MLDSRQLPRNQRIGFYSPEVLAQEVIGQWRRITHAAVKPRR